MIKLRFAPSPTGNLHVGNFRTALINFLYAKKHNGHFLLRLDDTDTERSKLKFEESIKEDLTWANINWDSEAKQSNRIERYNDVLKIFIEKEFVYPCYETAEELSLKSDIIFLSYVDPSFNPIIQIKHNKRIWDLWYHFSDTRFNKIFHKESDFKKFTPIGTDINGKIIKLVKNFG